MKSKQNIEIIPITQKEFRIRCFKGFGTFFSSGILSSVILWWAGQHNYIDFQTFFMVALLVLLLVLLRLIEIVDIRPRLKAIYGEDTPSFNFILCTPFVFVPIYLRLLSIKDSESKIRIPFYFRSRKAFFLLVLIFNIILPLGSALNIVPRQLFLGVAPTVGFLLRASEDVDNASNEKNKMRKRVSEGKSLTFSDNYLNSGMSSLLVILSQVHYFSEMNERIKLLPPSTKKTLPDLDPGLELLEKWNDRGTWFTKMSPLNLLSPANLVEGILISLVEKIAIDQSKIYVFDMYLKIFNEALIKYPDQNERIKSYDERLKKSPNYQYGEMLKKSYTQKFISTILADK